MIDPARMPRYALDPDFCEVVEDFARYGDLATGMLPLLRELANVNEAARNDVCYPLGKAHALAPGLDAVCESIGW